MPPSLLILAQLPLLALSCASFDGWHHASPGGAGGVPLPLAAAAHSGHSSSRTAKHCEGLPWPSLLYHVRHGCHRRRPPGSLLELVFLAIEAGTRRRVEAVCKRWRDISRGSSVLWDAISWTGSVDTALQADSLASLLSWLRFRALPPRQLRLNLRLRAASWPAVLPGAVAQCWVLLDALVARCAPRLQRLTIVQEYPGILVMHPVTASIRAQCLPALGAWLLPCRELQHLQVVAPRVDLHPHLLQRLQLQQLTLKVNMTTYGNGGVHLEEVFASQLGASSLTSLDLSESDMQLQPGVLASLPHLRRLVACNLQFPQADDFTPLTERADGLQELQLHTHRCVVPPQLAALTQLRQLLISGLADGASPDAAGELGQALSRLPLLEALSLAQANWALLPGEQQGRLWAAWQPAPRRLRSLEVQCGAASQVPPKAAPHLQRLHTLVCDWVALCSSPGMLAGCTQLRQLHVVCNGPPFRQGVAGPPPAPHLAPQLLDHLAAMPRLAAIHFFNFRPMPGAATGLRPMPALALQLLSEAAARLPGLHIPPVVVAGHEGVQLDLRTA